MVFFRIFVKKRENMVDYNVWFTSDLHFCHRNILKYTDRVNRMGLDADSPNLDQMNQWIIDKWNSRVQKNDIVYMLGDFSFINTNITRKFLEKLKGNKHLIWGNHDKSLKGLENYFESCSDIKDVVFKQSSFPFLQEDVAAVLCHYPILAWNGRNYGSLMIHGHSHGNLDDFNIQSKELRVDVGIDSKLADYDMVSLEQIYEYMKKVSNGKPFNEYIKEHIETTGMEC